MIFPSGLKLTLVTKSLCPVKVVMGVPSFFQSLIVLSVLPEAMISPSGLKLMLFTQSRCPISPLGLIVALVISLLLSEIVLIKLPSICQNFTVPSLLIERIVLSEIKVALTTKLGCSNRVFDIKMQNTGILPSSIFPAYVN